MQTIPEKFSTPETELLSVRYLSTSSLKPDERNARTHSKAQIRKIAESIRAFGFTNPVLIDDQGTIIAGHGRVEAAKFIGLQEVPTIPLASLTPAQVRAYVIADTRLCLDAGWNCRRLRKRDTTGTDACQPLSFRRSRVMGLRSSL